MHDCESLPFLMSSSEAADETPNISNASSLVMTVILLNIHVSLIVSMSINQRNEVRTMIRAI